MTATKHLWPRMMRRSTAAAYLDMPVADFEREMSKGRLPMPIDLGGQERWSRNLLDEAVERLTGAVIPDYRAKSKFYVKHPELLAELGSDSSTKGAGRKR